MWREIGAAFHGCVVGDYDALATHYAADAGDDAGPRHLLVVHVPLRKRGKFEHLGVRVKQFCDALTHQQLVAPAVLRARRRSAALFGLGESLLQVVDLRAHL